MSKKQKDNQVLIQAKTSSVEPIAIHVHVATKDTKKHKKIAKKIIIIK